MHLSAQAQYDATVERVAAMLADPVFVEAKVRASGATSQQVDVVGSSDESFTVTTRRQMPTTSIPSQFRSFVGASRRLPGRTVSRPLGTARQFVAGSAGG